MIRGALSGSEIHLHFFGTDDLRKSDYGSEIQPQNWVQLTLPEDEARALRTWLDGSRAVDYRSSRLTVGGSADWLIIEAQASGFVVRLGNSDLVASFAREISGALSLIIGRAVDPVGSGRVTNG